MIPIKINGKKCSIKPISELNTREFIEVNKVENLDTVKYIAWQTQQNMDSAFFAVTSKTVERAIGQIPDIRKLPWPKRFSKKLSVETIGQRHQIEACGLTGYELLVFTLAVVQARSNNIDDVNLLYRQYMEDSFAEILPAGFFLFSLLQLGRSSEEGYLKRLLALMRIVALKSKRALKS